jgi:hypothetical protein
MTLNGTYNHLVNWKISTNWAKSQIKHGGNITAALSVTGKQVGLEVNAEDIFFIFKQIIPVVFLI